MFLDRSKFTEPAYIGKELFSNGQDDKDHQCMIVRKTVQDGVFTLQEALKAYEVDKEDYEVYIAKNLNDELMTTLHSSSDALSQTMYIHVMNKMISNLFGNYDHKDLNEIYKRLDSLSRDIEEEKVKF